jgi:hypothetical protein
MRLACVTLALVILTALSNEAWLKHPALIWYLDKGRIRVGHGRKRVKQGP